MKYKYLIEETLSKVVEVEAETKELADDLVIEKYKKADDDFVLYSGDYYFTEIWDENEEVIKTLP